MKRISLIIVLLAACRHESKLKQRVDFYCSQLRSDLREQTSEYVQLAPQLAAATSPHARERVETLLGAQSIGATEQVRWARVRDLRDRLEFCARARQMDDARFTDVQVRLQKLLEQFISDDALQHSDKTVELLGQFTALLAEIEAIPLLD